eukprot:TRINITY_DN9398_c0_g1_i1.p1 TRINITY_DN9398_c0_g1~~TRINITY_DN9398_c0_g1_i1.p1  ORF type:complete len:513 (+),score=131.70 TRINITY_DN9398_c0_g1_i1:56-1594(+)
MDPSDFDPFLDPFDDDLDPFAPSSLLPSVAGDASFFLRESPQHTTQNIQAINESLSAFALHPNDHINSASMHTSQNSLYATHETTNPFFSDEAKASTPMQNMHSSAIVFSPHGTQQNQMLFENHTLAPCIEHGSHSSSPHYSSASPVSYQGSSSSVSAGKVRDGETIATENSHARQLPTNHLFSTATSQVRTRRSKYATKMEAIMQAGSGPLQLNSPKSSVERSRETARESRRKSKERMQVLESRAEKLRARIQELQEKFWFTQEKLRHEQEQLAWEMESHAYAAQGDADCDVLISRFIDVAYSKGTSAILHHIDRIKELLVPAQQVKFILWGLDQHDEFYNPTENPHVPTIWNLLTQEMDWTDAQRAQLFHYRDIIRHHNQALSRCNVLLDELRLEVVEKRTNLLHQIDGLRNIMTPQQQAKFMVWVERNRSWIQTLNTMLSLPPDPPRKDDPDLETPTQRNRHRIRNSYINTTAGATPSSDHDFRSGPSQFAPEPQRHVDLASYYTPPVD